jgi:hypothetical protein
VGFEGLLGDLDRRAAQPFRLPVAAASYGFRWDWHDMADREWWPQGITTSGDAVLSGQVSGRPVVAVSWYAKPRTAARSRGTRVSFVDVSDPVAPRYAHVLLIEPGSDDGADAGWKPVRVHAGGIAWYGRDLLVVDTRRGIRSFALDDIVRIDSPTGGFRYLLPQRVAYRQEDEEGVVPFRYSFVSVDRSDLEHRLVVGEYGTRIQSQRLCRYPLDPATSTLRVDDTGSPGRRWAVSHDVVDGVPKMQGAVTIGATAYLSTSRGRFRRGTMCTLAADGTTRAYKATLAIGPEDLAYWPQRDQIWSVSEYPGRFPRRRFVYAMPRTGFALS